MNKFVILPERLRRIQEISLRKGSHSSPIGEEIEACVMELAAWVAGEPWSENPQCACPVMTQFMIAWNDGLPSDEDRDRLLKPLIPRLVNSRSTEQVAERRAYMALDWLIRVHTPKWLDLVPSLHEHAIALRALDEIADMAGATAAGIKVREANVAADAAWAASRAAALASAVDASRAASGAASGAAAREAAWAAAWEAAWAAAWEAARDAAGEAAGAAAGDASRAAAWAASRAASRDAAWAAAWDAAGAAAGEAAREATRAALKPTTEWLQTSALELVDRMLQVKS